MIVQFLKTTFKLWLNVPGCPPLWKCAVVALVVLDAPKPNKMGSVVIEDLVDSDIEE